MTERNITESSKETIKFVEGKIGEFRRMRKTLLSPEYQNLVLSLEAIQANSLRVQYSGDISISIWDQPAFTYTDNPELLSTIEYIDDLVGEMMSSPTRNVDFPTDLTRMYHWSLRLRGHSFSIDLHVHLLEDGVCKRVQVGTKKQLKLEYIEESVPEYQFTC